MLSPAEWKILADLVLQNKAGTTIPNPKDRKTRQALEALVAHRYIDLRHVGPGRSIAVKATREGRLRILDPDKLTPAAECSGCDVHTARCGHPDYCCAACPEL